MPYLALLESDGRAHGGHVPELHVSAVGKSAKQVRERLEQGMALAIQQLQLEGRAVPEGRYRAFDDLPPDLQEDFAGAIAELLEAAPINLVSLEVERAVQASGLSDSEVARRMGTSPAAVGRMQDYFYWGHSLASLRRLADVLGARVEFRLTAA